MNRTGIAAPKGILRATRIPRLTASTSSTALALRDAISGIEWPAEPSVTEQILALHVADAWLRWEAERVD
jgi:hypothetical protein